MPAVLEQQEFLKHLNTKFKIQVDDQHTVDAELVHVSEHKLSPQQERFSIEFRAGNELFLGQGMRTFDHDAMGAFDLFIVPVRQDESGTYYEAVFNRMVKG
jgi:hypothetical protein